jgi:hypothetical protein
MIEMAQSADGKWEQVLEALPAEDRRDMATMVRWMLSTEKLPLAEILDRLKTGGKG